MDRVFIRLPATATEALQVVSYVQGHWQRIASWSNVSELSLWARAHAGIAAVLITPVGLDVALLLEATPKQRREAGIGLVALAEDYVAEDYENLHWVLDSVDETQVLARGIREDWLKTWLSLLSAEGIVVQAAVPESCLLSASAENWVWLPVGDEVFLHTGPGQSALISATDAPLLLATLLDQRPLKSPVRLRYPQGTVLPTLPDAAQPSPAPWRDWADLLKMHEPAYWLRHPQNWLSGALAVRQTQPGSAWWGVAASLALVTVLLSTGMNRFEAHRYQAEADAALTSAEQIYRSTFPEDHHIEDLRRQFAAKMQSAGGVGPAQLLQLLAQTAPSASWQVQRLDYHEKGTTTLEVSGNTLAEVQSWVGALNGQGLAVTLQNARLEGGQAKASLSLNMSKGQG